MEGARRLHGVVHVEHDWPELILFLRAIGAEAPRSGASRDRRSRSYDCAARISPGYNKTELLAEGVAAGLDVPIYSALSREGSQTSLSPRQRQDNVRGAFTLTPSGLRVIRGTHIVLVDDVLTTGVTGAEAATTLASGGADQVTLFTFARALVARPQDAA